MMSCSASRRGITREARVEEERFTDCESERYSSERVEVRDTVYYAAAVAVHDTLREVTTVTVQIGAEGDTVMRSVVTDRFRGRGVVAEREWREKVFLGLQVDCVEVRLDSVIDVERGEMVVRSDGTMERSGGFGSWISGLVMVFKWGVGLVFCLVSLRVVWWVLRKR